MCICFSVTTDLKLTHLQRKTNPPPEDENAGNERYNFFFKSPSTHGLRVFEEKVVAALQPGQVGQVFADGGSKVDRRWQL